MGKTLKNNRYRYLPTLDKDAYKYFLLPMWKVKQSELFIATRNYRLHLLALSCLKIAKGPGADPLELTKFCAKWKLALTMPFIGPVTLIRKIGRPTGTLGEFYRALRGIKGAHMQLPKFVHWATRTGNVSGLSYRIPIISIIDITNAINIGIEILANIGPLLSKLQMNQANNVALDR